MGGSVEELQRIGVRVFCADGIALRPRAAVPIFHRWIQSQAIATHLLIDVADYDHVPDGPGIVLVAHEGLFSLDRAAGRLGLAYTRKTASPGRLADRLRLSARSALLACRLLEDEAGLGERIRFRGDEIQVYANDRRCAPNTPEALAALHAPLMDFLHILYGDHALTIAPEADTRERLAVHVRAPVAVDTRELLRRLA